MHAAAPGALWRDAGPAGGARRAGAAQECTATGGSTAHEHSWGGSDQRQRERRPIPHLQPQPPQQRQPQLRSQQHQPDPARAPPRRQLAHLAIVMGAVLAHALVMTYTDPLPQASFALDLLMFRCARTQLHASKIMNVRRKPRSMY